MGLLDDLRASRRAAGGRWKTPNPGTDYMVPALLFIPDISGFTRFIEASGSRLAPYLIADLLEILIEANLLDMQVSEIQGDAILFYRLGPPPSIADMVMQCRRIFLDFQNYLRLVERDTDSDLGAALRNNDLTLKIIVHYGRVSIAQIREHTKLMGRDLIVVHRLLKNDVTGSEYALFSEDYLQTQTPADIARSFTWTRLLRGSTVYEHLGRIEYRYAHLTPLRQLLESADAGPSPSGQQSNALQVRRAIRVPASYALRVISNFRLRSRWLQGATGVLYDLTKAGRLGTSYKVNLNRGQIDFQAVQLFEDEEERTEYVEKISLFRVFPNSLLFYFIQPVDARSCLVTLEFRYGHVVGSRVVQFGQLRRMHRFLGASIRQLAALCERMNRKTVDK
ncbi:DUF2652 domain-containing protein [Hymenobacter sp. BT491]|uniref:DUF2652 domain-containing protein n=1 Tax=Hymenobacter sp. BT491 TaxID=2766779 RepID=UPI0016539C37|nr:DUF2652 domain-containing protein [Hymenobacter sp. BT491]MBC6991082.1 DUF2652 domain-containing protein [Hymenobacter sp. BT491]